jgi:hypothetical protein
LIAEGVIVVVIVIVIQVGITEERLARAVVDHPITLVSRY